MAKLRSRPKSVPKGARNLWDNTALEVLRLEQLLERLEGVEGKEVAERVVLVAREDLQSSGLCWKCKEEIDADEARRAAG